MGSFQMSKMMIFMQLRGELNCCTLMVFGLLVLLRYFLSVLILRRSCVADSCEGDSFFAR